MRQRTAVSRRARRTPSVLIAVVLAATASFGVPAAASANPSVPANDAFASATNIAGLPYTQAGVDNRGATLESSEPFSTCGSTGHTVWYQYTPTVGTTLYANVVPATVVGNYVHADIAVYTGSSLALLSQVACTYGSSSGSELAFPVAAGMTYFIQVGDSYTGGIFDFSLRIHVPANDFFAFATTVPSLPFTETGADTRLAGTETSEPTPSCGGADNTSWYKFTATSHTSLAAVVTPRNIVGNQMSPVIAAYSGTALTSLTRVACAYGSTTRLVFPVDPSTTYYIQVSDYDGGLFDFSLQAQVPANDLFAFSTQVGSLPYLEHNVDTTGATIETGEPNSTCGSADHSAWYAYKAEFNGTAMASVIPTTATSANFYPRVAVYTGATMVALSAVGCASGYGTERTSVPFGVTAGTTYFVQVSEYDGGVFDFGLAPGTGPSVTAPTVALRSGVVLPAGSVPVRVSWIGTADGSPIASYTLQRRVAGSWSTVCSTAVAICDTTQAAGASAEFQVIATDAAERSATSPSTYALWPTVYQESAYQIRYKGTWTRLKTARALGGALRYAKKAGASATFTSFGKSVAWVSTRAASRGYAKVYVNGRFAGRVSLKGGTAYRWVAWSAYWGTAASRTIRIVVEGTRGHPQVDVDGFITLQ
jgi:hypothetical protein